MGAVVVAIVGAVGVLAMFPVAAIAPVVAVSRAAVVDLVVLFAVVVAQNERKPVAQPTQH